MANENKTEENANEILTCADIAKELKTTRQTVWKWIATGRIDPDGCFQIGKKGHWRIYRSALQKALTFSTGGLKSEWMNTFDTKIY